MKNKQNRSLIIIIGIALILVCAITIAWFVILSKDNSNNTVNNPVSNTSSGEPIEIKGEVKDEIERKISLANELNKLYIDKKYDKKNSYVNDNGDTCYAYDGDDTERVIKDIESIYYDDIDNISIYETEYVSKTKETRLYLCYPKDCTIKTLDDKSYSVLHETKDTKIIKFAETEQVLIATENEGWQFSIPLVFCEENKEMDFE